MTFATFEQRPAGVAPRRRTLLLLILASTVAMSGAAISLAQFTDSEALGGNSLSTGTIDLSLSPTTALFTASAMMPGDAVNGTLVVSNAGTGQLRYAMTSSATNADGLGLATLLTLAVREVGSGCAAFDGPLVSGGILSGAAFGDPAQGADGGDRVLAGATSETLCFRASLPLTVPASIQGAATTVTFTFDAEQTANNP